MKKDFRVFVDDIVDSINKIENSTKNIDFDTFVSNYEKNRHRSIQRHNHRRSSKQNPHVNTKKTPRNPMENFE